jgi:hypothetical protein
MVKILNRTLPQGIDMNHIHEMPTGSKRQGRLRESDFLVTVATANGHLLREKKLSAFLSASHFRVRKATSKGECEVDLKALVKTIKLPAPNQVQLTLIQDSGPRLRPIEIVKQVFSIPDTQLTHTRVLKTSQVVD